MSNELQLIQTDVLSPEEKTTLGTEIDRIVAEIEGEEGTAG